MKSILYLVPLLVFSACTDDLKTKHLKSSEAVFGLEFTDAERDSMLMDVREQRDFILAMRTLAVRHDEAPAMIFNPLPSGFYPDQRQMPIRYRLGPISSRPNDIDSLAFEPIHVLAERIRTRQIRSEELTQMYIDRIKRYDPQLMAVITLLENEALEKARLADAEIASGRYRGPLHGIPYGAKDLLAYPGHKTTWGATPYKNQTIDVKATVIAKLEAAGAILVAKTTLGALAWGDVWFGGTTKNPWDLEQGSSGSSAGSTSTVSAGLLPFAIGSETWGSIVSPSTRTRITGLRPTFGRVSRHGAMPLSWSMDKLGPICRDALDCAIIFDVIRGSDGFDRTVIDASFNFDATRSLDGIRFGYVKEWFEDEPTDVLDAIRAQGVELIEVTFPDMNITPLSIILSAESAAAFEDLTLSKRDDLLVRQMRNAWPNVFRAGRLIPAVDYLQANRLRTRLIEETHRALASVDVVIVPSFAGGQLLLTNLTGHPAMVMPTKDGNSITFVGQLFDEATLIRAAMAWQAASDIHLQQPPLFTVKPQ